VELHLLLAGTWGVSAGVVVWIAIRGSVRRQTRARMEVFGLGPQSSDGSTRPSSFRTVATAAGGRIESLWPAAARLTGDLLQGAGLAGAMSVAEMLGWKVLAAGLGALLATMVLALGPAAAVLALVFAAVGWLVPDLWLLWRKAARTREMERSLMTVTDVLALSLEAGMSLERALRVICERVPSPLGEEVRQVLNDISLGAARRDAFQRMVDRVPLEDVRLLAAAIIQVEELGGSLVTSMRRLGHEIRIRRRRRADANALRAPVKMMIPLVLFTLPALIIVVIGPALFHAAGQLPR